MGNKNTGGSRDTNLTEDEDYLNFIREKNKRDEEKHKVFSNREGTAFHKLSNSDRNQEA